MPTENPTGPAQAQELLQRLADASPQELLAEVSRRFPGRAALATSFGAEDQVLTHMLAALVPQPRIFTLDTGRLPQETYDVMDATRQRYGITIKVLFPRQEDVEAMVTAHGPNLFYTSVEARKRCCHVRKVVPLQRELAQLTAWITGLRREQAPTRTGIQRIEWDADHGLIKINPLADWTTDQVWAYIREHRVPYNKLHDQGYPSIGCAPCTRAVPAGEDIRSGRWWWEQPEHRECGLHVVNGQLVRAKTAQQ